MCQRDLPGYDGVKRAYSTGRCSLSNSPNPASLRVPRPFQATLPNFLLVYLYSAPYCSLK